MVDFFNVFFTDTFWVFFRNFTKLAMLALKVYMRKIAKYIKRVPPVGIELGTSAIAV